jgi:hypothetical protein
VTSPIAGAAPVRTTHVLHLAPVEASRLAHLALPGLGAVAAGEPAVFRTLILTEDAELASAVAFVAANELGGGAAPIVALTAERRALRVLRRTPPRAMAVPVDVALALLRQSTLPLAELRTLIVGVPQNPPPELLHDLETVLAEIPRTATRTLVAAAETPAVSALVERFFFNARRTRESDIAAPVPPERQLYVVTAPLSARREIVRRLLDQLDPPSASIWTPDVATYGDIAGTLASLGHGADDPVHASRDIEAEQVALMVLVGVPDAGTLRRALASRAERVVVVCTAREVAELRSLAGAGSVQAIALDEPRTRAERRDAHERARIRAIVESGAYVRELLALSPLFDVYDAGEVAAAALAYATELARARPAVAPAPAVQLESDQRPANAELRRSAATPGDRSAAPRDRGVGSRDRGTGSRDRGTGSRDRGAEGDRGARRSGGFRGRERPDRGPGPRHREGDAFGGRERDRGAPLNRKRHDTRSGERRDSRSDARRDSRGGRGGESRGSDRRRPLR